MSHCRLLVGAATLGLVLLPTAAQSAGKRYAVLVGVEQYQHAKLREPEPLKYSVDDVADMAVLLRAAGYDVTLMTDDTGKSNDSLAPTKANIDAQIARVLRLCKADDTVVLALTGHGLQFTGQKDAYFCPADARPFADETATLVSVSAIYAGLEKSFAGVKVIFVDACRNDPDPGRGRGLDADSAPSAPKGVAALFSCSAGQKAFEHDELRHGVFFHYVLEGMRGEAWDREGNLTFEGLATYVRTNVPRKVTSLFSDRKQLPNLKADLVGIPPVLLDESSRAQFLPSRIRLVRRFGKSARPGTHVAISPDGKFLAMAELSDNPDDESHPISTLVLSRIDTGARVRVLGKHTDDLNCARFSQDGKWLASGGAVGDQRLKVWDVTTGKLIQETKRHSWSPMGVVFDTVGGRPKVLYGTYNHSVHSLDLLTGASDVIELPYNTPWVFDVHSAKQFAMLAGTPGIQLVDLKSRKLVWSRDFNPDDENETQVHGGAFSPGGAEILIGVSTDKMNAGKSVRKDTTLRLLATSSGRDIDVLRGHTAEITGVAFLPRGDVAVTAGRDGRIMLWDLRTRRTLVTESLDKEEFSDLSMTADGRFFATASKDSVGVWEIVSP